MSNPNHTKEYFTKVSGNWDNLRKRHFTESVNTVAIERAHLRPEMVVADIGGGTGFMSQGLASLVMQVHLVEVSQEMLAVAQSNLKEYDNIVFHLADGLSIPLPDESMDAVFANMYMHHTPEPLSAIQEMSRILRPGGRLVITDLDSHQSEWMRDEMADIRLGFTHPQMREWFQAAGLVNQIVDCTDHICCVKPTASENDQPVEISVFVAVGTKRVLGARQQVQEHYGSLAESVSSCCGSEKTGYSSCCSGGDLLQVDQIGKEFIAGQYTFQDQLEAPGEAVEFSLGCGNPVAIAKLQPGETVLDIGSGGGLDVFLSARRVGPTGKVIGVDMTPAMLERARSTARDFGLQNVEFRQGQAENLPVLNDSVDVIISNCVINLCEDKGAVFREAARALKPGGRLEVSDMVTDGSLPVEFRSNPRNWGSCVYGALPEQEYTDLIQQAGFQDIRVSRSTGVEMVGDVKIYSAIVSANKQ